MGVRCLLCGLEFRVVNASHLRYAHAITVDEYRKQFPGVELTSEETREQFLKAWADEEVYRRRSESQSRAMTPEVRLRTGVESLTV